MGAGASLVRAPATQASASPDSLRLLIVTDAWSPQVNGVVRTLETLGRDLEQLGHEVRYATPEEFAEFKRRGYEMGFQHVESGPLVRSSYHAADAVS